VSFTGIDLFAALAAITGVWMCGVTLVHSLVWIFALQAGVLGIVTVLVGVEHASTHYYVLAAGLIGIKALAIPWFLDYTVGRVGVRRDLGATLHPTLAQLAAIGALAAGFFLADRIAPSQATAPGAGGMALSLLLVGMLLMMTRRLAVSQVIGFLVLENGIFLYALTQTHGIPLMVEMGILLDVLVGVMIAGVVIFRLNRSFEHIDVTQLRGLKD
jgi:hydrogenase-4 component E